jgi:hypothetical protein
MFRPKDTENVRAQRDTVSSYCVHNVLNVFQTNQECPQLLTRLEEKKIED